MKPGARSILFVYVVIELLGMSLILPLLPYCARSFSASALLVGLLGTSNVLAQVLGAPLVGRLSDRFGRRPLILAGALATAVGFFMLGFARSLWLMFASRVL